ncbi:MAG: hypothetical protein WAT71_03975 [Ignavibacteria bacterium]
MINLKFAKIFFILFTVIFAVSSCGKDSGNSREQSGSDNSKGNESTATKEINDSEISEKANSDKSNLADGISDLKFGKDLVPSFLKDENKIIEAVSWNDKLGENLIVITLTDERTIVGDERIKEFFVYHYIIKDTSAEVLWKSYDFIKDCPFDITLEFIDSSLTVTDLDGDDIAETSFMYKLSCRSDVSYDDLKLIMHEGHDKYAIRGEMILKINDEDPSPGSMNIDDSFNKTKIIFKDFAIGQWNKFNKVFIGEKYEK